MRFHPKRRASTDHAPGPSNAKPAPIVAKKMQAHGSPGREMVFQIPMAATSDPEIGVHKPASRSIPTAIASVLETINWIGGPDCSLASPLAINEAPDTSRMSRRTLPGQPGSTGEY